jgi:hypothetical protein
VIENCSCIEAMTASSDLHRRYQPATPSGLRHGVKGDCGAAEGVSDCVGTRMAGCE